MTTTHNASDQAPVPVTRPEPTFQSPRMTGRIVTLGAIATTGDVRVLGQRHPGGGDTPPGLPAVAVVPDGSVNVDVRGPAPTTASCGGLALLGGTL